MGEWNGSDPDRNGDGWLMIDVASNEPPSGSIVEIRGELDRGMELAVGRMLLDLNATVQRLWDPTEQVDDDLLPGIV